MTERSPLGEGDPSDRAAVWAAMLEVYAGASAGDSARADAVISPAATFWDTDEPDLAHGLDQLQKVRDRRPVVDGDPFTIDAHDPVVTVFGDTAVLRHVFEVTPAGAAASTVRNTSVWRRDDDRWLLVHNHEDVLAAPR